jgi:hypothetical protein
VSPARVVLGTPRLRLRSHAGHPSAELLAETIQDVLRPTIRRVGVHDPSGEQVAALPDDLGMRLLVTTEVCVIARRRSGSARAHAAPGGVQVDDRNGRRFSMRGQAGSLLKVTLDVLEQPGAVGDHATQRNEPSSCSSARLARPPGTPPRWRQ